MILQSWNRLQNSFELESKVTDWRCGYSAVLAQLPKDLPARVIDYGVGPGLVARYASRMGHHVDGVDISPLAIEKSKLKVPEGDFCLVDDWIPEAVYDFAMMNYVLCTIPNNSEALTALSRVYQGLRPEGVFCLLDPHPDAPGLHFPDLHRTYPEHNDECAPVSVRLGSIEFTDYWRSKAGIESLLEDVGFEISKVIESPWFAVADDGSPVVAPPNIVYVGVKSNV